MADAEADLVRAAQAGDVSSLGSLLTRHRPAQLAVAHSILGPGPDAEDAVQEAALATAGRGRSGHRAGRRGPGAAARPRPGARPGRGGRVPATDAERGELRGAISYAAETARAVLTAMYEAGSSDPIHESSRLGQVFQDGMAAAQHANMAAAHYELAGRTRLGLPPNALIV